MKLNRLSLTNFRSYRRLDLEIPDGISVLSGGNAQGKTTLLEALFYCASFASPLSQSNKQLIHFDALREPIPVARIVIWFNREGKDHSMETRIIGDEAGATEKARKEILLDGVKVSVHKAVGAFPATLFIPQMTRILEGPPDERRRYLNIMLSQSVPTYARALADYKQISGQRNALLKQLNERGGDASQLDYWDEMLAQRAAMLILHRNKALIYLSEQGREIHSVLTDNAEVLQIEYQPSFAPQAGMSQTQEIQAEYRQFLKNRRAKDIERRITSTGPHRDDFIIHSNSLNLSDYGSRGQIRTALLTLKMAEARWIRENTGTSPLLLLDETMAELDEKRRCDLLKWVGAYDQGILTTTELSFFSDSFLKSHSVFFVSNGMAKPARTEI